MKKIYIVPKQINIELDSEAVLLNGSDIPQSDDPASGDYGVPTDPNYGNNDSRNSLWDDEW